MSICPSCNGVIGRDCFNPSECMEITQDMAERGQAADEEIHSLKQALDAQASRIATLEGALRELPEIADDIGALKYRDGDGSTAMMIAGHLRKLATKAALSGAAK